MISKIKNSAIFMLCLLHHRFKQFSFIKIYMYNICTKFCKLKKKNTQEKVNKSRTYNVFKKYGGPNFGNVIWVPLPDNR